MDDNARWEYYWNPEVKMCILRIARQMGIRVNNRQPHEVMADIERYIEVAPYKKPINPVGKVSTWP